MAFTAAQEVEIRHYLGFPQTYVAENFCLEGAMDVVGADSDKQAKAEEILAALVVAEAKITTMLSTAGIKQVDEVKFFGNEAGSSGLRDACRYGRMLAGRLSILLGVPVVNDIFGPDGYMSDGWRGMGFQMGGAAHEIPLG